MGIEEHAYAMHLWPLHVLLLLQHAFFFIFLRIFQKDRLMGVPTSHLNLGPHHMSLMSTCPSSQNLMWVFLTLLSTRRRPEPIDTEMVQNKVCVYMILSS